MQNKSVILKELEELLSGKTLKPLSGIPKKCYKYSLTAVFINLCFGRQLTQGQEVNFNYLYSIKNRPQNFNKPEILDDIKQTVEDSLALGSFHNINNYQTIDLIIEFFRELVLKTKKDGTFLVTVSEIQKLLDVKTVFNATHNNVKSHHWIEIDIMNGMILTVPEFFTYVDVVNSWNMLIDKLDEYNFSMDDNSIPLIERKNNPENRKLKYEIDTLSRTLCISAVTFTESYLYYLFYNLKQNVFQAKSDAGKSILKLQKVEDEEILQRLVLPEFFDNKDNELSRLIKKYSNVNKIRNRFIHTSAFLGKSNSSELLPLITTSINDIVEYLEVCIGLARKIDGQLPEEFQILVWWDRITHPEFKDFKKGNPINQNSRQAKIKYTEDYLF
ncbi:hypothetical protein ABEY24_10365 [Peribacillus frigoritolerans]|uniref:hypothetical protein n=1 Tax=Peribacillus frigoritolerans TaxID=450367 RepID=UPI003D2D98BA